MNNKIVVMDLDAGEAPLTLVPTSFAELGLQERQHLEEWIKKNPDILGTKLLLIASEYDRFDKSEKRLDLLALDAEGKLVIIELKRDAAGSYADLQALHYAAFCSTMTFEDIVDLYAKFAKTNTEEAEQNIREFVNKKDFSTVDNKPRIILAAGGFDDPEITSCVLWLRSFGVDISCVEITPYRMSGTAIVLAPRVIIPLPEAKDYIVRAERKEAVQSGVKRVAEESLLETAKDRGISSLLDVCRQLTTVWHEAALSVYGGSFLYSLTTEKGWRSLFGVNVSGQRKKTPNGQLDIWIPIKNLVEVTGQDESVMRDVFVEDQLQLIAEEKIDLIMRLSNADEAQVLVDRLRGWTPSAPPA